MLIVMAVIEPATFLLTVQIINYKATTALVFSFGFDLICLLSLVGLYVPPPKDHVQKLGLTY